MPWLIWLPSTLTRIVSVTSSVPSARTSMSLRHERMRSPCGGTSTLAHEAAAQGLGVALPVAGNSRASAARSGASSDRIRFIGSGLGRAELDLRRLLDRGIRVGVEFRLGKAERAREQHVRERLDTGVEITHRGVVVAPCA